ncbi:MAG: hypothetical protein HGN29_05930 [Asgard group archaeon]|nr:hypothetical protein [Asgard group archaeon]
MKNSELYKYSKKTYNEAILHTGMNTAGSSQAKFLERVEKDKNSAKAPAIILKAITVLYIAIMTLVPVVSLLQIATVSAAGVSPQWVNFVGGLSMSGFLLFLPVILLIFSVMFTWGLMSGGPYEWLGTLPFSRRDVQKIGMFTFIRGMNLQLIAIGLLLPVGIIIGVLIQNNPSFSVPTIILLIFSSIVISIINVIFILSLVVIVLRKMAILMEGSEIGDKKTTFFRIFSVVVYLMATMLMSILIRFAMEKIPQLYPLQSIGDGTTNIISIILSFIPFPFAGGFLLSNIALGFESISVIVLVGSIIGLLLYSVITYFMYNKAIDMLKGISSTEIKDVKIKDEEQLQNYEIVNSSPVKAFIRRDLSLITREMQLIIFMIMPLMIPIFGAIGTIDADYFGTGGISIGFIIIMFYVALTTVMLIMGLTYVDAGGETITSSLPIIERDKFKSKLPYFFINIPLGLLLTIPVMINQGGFLDNVILILIFLPAVPLIGISTLLLKVVMFGKLRYKNVLDEINNSNKTVKYITLFLFPASLLVGLILLTQIELYLVGVAEAILLVILIFVANKMFPKADKSKETTLTSG